MAKYDLLPQQLLHEGVVNETQFFHPDPLTREEILLTHSEEFLDKLEKGTLDAKAARKIGFPMTSALVERGKYIAKGTYLCAKYAQHNGVALNIAGGTHHSFRDHGEGFCVFNDIAIASNMLLSRGESHQILIVDLDVHQGNGTAKIFENQPQVFTFSMHGAKNYPLRKEKSDLDIGLPDGTSDDEYLHILRGQLESLLNEVKPDMIFYLAGADVISSDRLGRLSLSIEAVRQRDDFVFENCREHNIPVAVAMGGGYSPKIGDILDAHSATFKSAAYYFE